MRKLKLLLLMIPLSLAHLGFSQMRTISGTVKSGADASTLPGVSVFVKGTTIGAITDINGRYSLDVPKDKNTIVFSSIGFSNKEIVITDAVAVYDVSLSEISKNLNEVVVTANAIKREKRSLGYSTTQVGSESLTKGQNTNVLGALQGKTAGVNINSLSGAAGGSSRIVIRGGSSLTGNNQALIVVDGVPINNANRKYDNVLENQVDFGNRANDLNPQDIENISVLKGSSATALYGSRASNGVVLITTKKGGKVIGGVNKMNISLNSSVTFSNPLKLPTFQNTYGQGDLNGTFDDRRENFSWGLPFDNEIRPWGQIIDGKSRVKPYSALPNNVKDFFDTGVTLDNTLSFSGGGVNTDYYLSVNSQNSNQITPGNKFQKYGVRFNGNSRISEKLQAGISVNYSTSKSNLPNAGQGDNSVFNNLIQTPRDIPIIEGRDLEDPFNSYNDVTGQYGFYGAYTVNPYFNLQNNITNGFVDRVFGNVTLSYDPFEWLNIKNVLGADFSGERNFQKFKKYDYAPIDEFWAAAGNKTYQGFYSEDFYYNNQTNNDLMLTFKKNFSEDFTSSLLIGQNIFANKLINTFAQTNDQDGLIVPSYYNLNNSNGPIFAKNELFRNRIVGLYGDLNLGYKNTLFLNLTGRNDWSSTLPKSVRSYFYNGISASFVFSELFGDKLKGKAWNFGKLRASYGKTGKDADPYQLDNYFGSTNINGGFGNTVFPLNGVGGFTALDAFGNPNLKPEFTTETEIGTELSFLNDRINLDVAIYSKISKDQILRSEIANSTGFEDRLVNAGEFTNKGIEITLKLTPVLLPNGFTWDTYLTYTKNKSKVESLVEGLEVLNFGGFSDVSIAAALGKEYAAIYAVDLLTDPSGRVVIDTETGLPLTTPNIVYQGTTAPKFQASWANTFTYKSFSLSTLFDARVGGVFYSRTKSTMAFVGTSLETAQGGRDPKIWENSVYIGENGEYIANNEYTYDPYLYYTSILPEGQNIVDASYFKVREISIGYRLPERLLKKSFIGSASINLFGNNLFIVTANENEYADPEVNSDGTGNGQGLEFSALPSQRNYGINLKLSF